MSFRMARRAAWLFALLTVFGCGSTDLATVMTAHKAKVEVQLAKLAPIRDAARAAPPITQDVVDINGPAPRIGVFDVDEHANVAIEYLEDLDDLTALGAVPFRLVGSGSMNRCAAIYSTHRYPYNALVGSVPDEIPWYLADDNLKHCDAVRYVFVIRSVAYSAPSMIHESSGVCPRTDSADAGVPDAGVSTAKCNVFDGGYLRAEVLVYDLPTGKQLGGFRFTAENSTKIDVGGTTDREFKLFDDMTFKIRAAFNEAAQKHVPSFIVGY